MFPSYKREMVLYEATPSGFHYSRRTVPSFYPPDAHHSVYEGDSEGHNYVFPPDGRLLPYWGGIMILSVLYQATTVPLAAAFDLQDSHETIAVDFACTLVYMLDIVISFNTAFYRKGVLVTDRKTIAKQYLRTWLVPDIVSTFPYDWLIQEPLTSSNKSAKAPTLVRIVKIGRLLRSFRLIRLAKLRVHLLRIRERLMNSRLALLFTASYLLVMMLGVAHWIACGFFYISQVNESPENWVYDTGLQDAVMKDQYIAAVYWAVTTLTTTGYGDIHPVNTYEKIYGVIIMVISAGFFSFRIGKIGSAIANMDREKKGHKDLSLAVSRYLKQEKVPEKVMDRAKQFLNYVWESRKRRKTVNLRLLGHFSDPLKSEVSEYIYAPVIQRIPMFQRFPRSFIAQLSLLIRLEIFAKEDLVFQAGHTSTQVYFIERGLVEIFHQPSGQVFRMLESGDYFGELAFFMGNPRCASARCADFCELLSLTRAAFLPLLSPTSQYEFNKIKALYGYKDFAALGLSCYSCSQTSHLAVECPGSRIQINKLRIWDEWRDARNIRTRVLNSVDVRPNFKRKEKKILRASHYSKENTSRKDASEPLRWRSVSPVKAISTRKGDLAPVSSESCLISQHSTGGNYHNEPESPRNLPLSQSAPGPSAVLKRSLQITFA
jgi:hypothetical protein